MILVRKVKAMVALYSDTFDGSFTTRTWRAQFAVGDVCTALELWTRGKNRWHAPRVGHYGIHKRFKQKAPTGRGRRHTMRPATAMRPGSQPRRTIVFVVVPSEQGWPG
jgi:hypothetical protein